MNFPKQLSSTLAPVPAGLWNYDANDRFTAGDTYDANGNTVSSGGVAVSYDFENRIILKAGVSTATNTFWDNSALVANELVHKITGVINQEIQSALGLKFSETRKNISDKLKGDCL